MKDIIPFNDVWLDCHNNLKSTLLAYMDQKYKYRGLNNNYQYSIFQDISDNGKEFDYITEFQKFFDYEEIGTLERVTPQNKDEFMNIVIQHLKRDNGFVLMRVDLYNWMEGSICWKKYHWDHYSLLVDYDDLNARFIVFDENKAEYTTTFIDENKLYDNRANNPKFEPLRLITINKEVKFPDITIEEIMENANIIIESIKKSTNRYYWALKESDYDVFSHKDVNGVYLQRIEGRLKADAMLMNLIGEKCLQDTKIMKMISEQFNVLANEWTSIRMALYMIYYRKANRKVLLDKINDKVKKTLLQEKENWEKMIRLLEDNCDKKLTVL